jgi:type VI secretion system protein ImpE
MPTADARSLYQEGRLSDAIASLNEALRSDPSDVASRTFLFELLCFAGAYDRARKQLHAISSVDPEAHLSTAWYQEALHAEEQRQKMFRGGELPEADSSPAAVGGTLNGEPIQDVQDADPRIGPRLEALVGERYMWIPFEHLAKIRIEPPTQLRDLFWIPAQIEGTDALGGHSGEILVPVMTPLAWQHPDELVRLGRLTEWEELDSGDEAPVGQKLLLVDGEDFPLLEVRELLFTPPEG